MKSPNARPKADSTSRMSRSEMMDTGGDRKAPSLAEIRERAFEIHIERGGIHGRDLWDRFLDWLQAKRELEEKYKEKTSRTQSEARH